MESPQCNKPFAIENPMMAGFVGLALIHGALAGKAA
jgi:hypothetical protein